MGKVEKGNRNWFDTGRGRVLLGPGCVEVGQPFVQGAKAVETWVRGPHAGERRCNL